MQSGNINNNIVDYLIVFLLCALSFKVIPGWIPPLRKDYILLGVCLVLVLIKSKPYISTYSSIFYPFFLFFLIALVNFLLGDEVYHAFGNVISSSLILLVPTCISLWCISNKELKIIRVFLIISCCLFVFELLSSFVILHDNPGLVRKLLEFARSESSGVNALMYEYYKLGLIDYSLAQSVVIIIPAFFFGYKSSTTRKSKILYLMLIFLFSAICFISDSTTALLLLVLVLLLGTLTITNVDHKRTVIAITVIILPLLFSDNIIISILDYLQNLLGPDSSHIEKINEIKYSILYDETEGDLAGRQNKYNQTINLFLHNPIFGSSNRVGNHSALLDQLATLGLLGFIPMISFLLMAIKIIMNYLSEASLMFYYEGLIAGILLLCLKGMWYWSVFFCLMLMLPLLLYYIDQKIDIANVNYGNNI